MYTSVVRPSGILPQLKTPHIIYDCPEQNDTEEYITCTSNQYPTFTFRLNQTLRLNVTFSQIKFSQTFCVLNKSSIIVDSLYPSRVERLKYCGIIPELNVFPTSPAVDIYFLQLRHIFLQTKMTYYVFDEKQVETCQTVGLNQPHTVSAFRFFLKYISLCVHHIKVAHHQVLIIATSMELDPQNKVHDGPGRKCKLLQPFSTTQNIKEFRANSFQVTIHTVRSWNASLTVFNYSGTTQLKTVIFLPTNKSAHIIFPNQPFCGVKSHCVIEFIAKDLKNINLLKVAQFTGTGTNNQNCDFSAIILLSEVQGQYKNFHTECVRQHYGKVYSSNWFITRKRRACEFVHNMTDIEYVYPQYDDSRTIYSESNNIVVVYYFYSEYGRLGMSVHVSPLECETIVIDTCDSAINNLAQRKPEFSVFTMGRRGRVGVSWKISISHCIILQFVHIPRKCAERVMEIVLISSPLSLVNISLWAMLEGNLEHIYSLCCEVTTPLPAKKA